MSLREIRDAALPGPWEYDGYEHVVAKSDIVCRTWDRPHPDGVPLAGEEQTARLIALAPQMADLLLEIRWAESRRSMALRAYFSITEDDRDEDDDGVDRWNRAWDWWLRFEWYQSVLDGLLASIDTLGDKA